MKSLIVPSLSLMALLLAGCGKGGTSAPAGNATPTVASFEVTANDSMKFNLTRLEAKAGQELKITLINTGTMAKAVMGHNLVVLKKDTDVKAFVDAAATATATDYIPASMADKIIAHTKLLGAKQSDEITFKAPAEAGEYPFICSFPAHYLVGMKGVLVVQ